MDGDLGFAATMAAEKADRDANLAPYNDTKKDDTPKKPLGKETNESREARVVNDMKTQESVQK